MTVSQTLCPTLTITDLLLTLPLQLFCAICTHTQHPSGMHTTYSNRCTDSKYDNLIGTNIDSSTSVSITRSLRAVLAIQLFLQFVTSQLPTSMYLIWTLSAEKKTNCIIEEKWYIVFNFRGQMQERMYCAFVFVLPLLWHPLIKSIYKCELFNQFIYTIEHYLFGGTLVSKQNHMAKIHI